MLREDEDSSLVPADDVTEAWQQEISRRLRQIDIGEVELIPWEETERRLWAKVPSK